MLVLITLFVLRDDGPKSVWHPRRGRSDDGQRRGTCGFMCCVVFFFVALCGIFCFWPILLLHTVIKHRTIGCVRTYSLSRRSGAFFASDVCVYGHCGRRIREPLLLGWVQLSPLQVIEVIENNWDVTAEVAVRNRGKSLMDLVSTHVVMLTQYSILSYLNHAQQAKVLS